jgi:integrase
VRFLDDDSAVLLLLLAPPLGFELRWPDVDLGRRTLRVERSYFRGHVGPPKTAHGRRRLRLSERRARALRERRKRTHAGEGDLVKSRTP